MSEAGPIHIEVQPRYRDVLAGRPRTAVEPLPDELLTSWVARLADHNGLAPRELATMLGLGTGMAWTRMDFAPPPHVVAALTDFTGVPGERIGEMALPPEFRVTLALAAWDSPLPSQPTWVQFCPDCLEQDIAPYLRRRWRLASAVYCSHHDRVLLDRCPVCGRAISGLSRPTLGRLDHCDECGFALAVSRHWAEVRRTKIARGSDTVSYSGWGCRRLARELDSTFHVLLQAELEAGVLNESGLLDGLGRLPTLVARHGLSFRRADRPPLRQLPLKDRIQIYSEGIGIFLRFFEKSPMPEATEVRRQVFLSHGIWTEEAQQALAHRREQLVMARQKALAAATDKLMTQPLLGRDVFPRGATEPLPDPRPREVWDISLKDLLTNYASVLARRNAARQPAE